MLVVQVVPARRRGRPRPLLDVRAARLRGGRGLHAAVPRARADRRRDRAPALRRGRAAQRGRRSSRRRPRSRPSRSSRTTSGGWCVRVREPERHRVQGRAVRGHRDPRRRRRAPVVLDGQRPRRARSPGVHDQALRGRPLLRPAGQRQRHLGRRRADLQGPVRHVHAARQLAAAARVHRRRRRDGAGPVAAALDGREGHRAPGDLLLRRAHARTTSSPSRRSSALGERAARLRRSSRRSRRPTTAATGTARPA